MVSAALLGALLQPLLILLVGPSGSILALVAMFLLTARAVWLLGAGSAGASPAQSSGRDEPAGKPDSVITLR